MHVDLWYPGLIDNSAGKKVYLLNSVCDITQYVVSSPTSYISAAALAKKVMSDFVLSLGMCSVIVIDNGPEKITREILWSATIDSIIRHRQSLAMTGVPMRYIFKV